MRPSIWEDRVLFVGAHSDDLEMCAGGTIHKLASDGVQVHAMTLVDHGVERKNESSQAHWILKVHESHFGYGRDKYLRKNETEMIEWAEEIIKRLEPLTVVTHYHEDTHQDHVAANRIVMAAARNVPNLLLFKPTFPSGRVNHPFHPNFVSKLREEDMRAKLSAMAVFESQRSKYGDEEWLESLKATSAGDAWTYGGFHGWAELFQVSRLQG